MNHRLACIDCGVLSNLLYGGNNYTAESLALVWRHRAALRALDEGLINQAELGRRVGMIDGRLHISSLWPGPEVIDFSSGDPMAHDDHDVRVATVDGRVLDLCGNCSHELTSHAHTGEGFPAARNSVIKTAGPCSANCTCQSYVLPPRPRLRTREELLPELARILRGAQPDRAEEMIRALEELLALNNDLRRLAQSDVGARSDVGRDAELTPPPPLPRHRDLSLAEWYRLSRPPRRG
jgi:hypothetical protein